MTTPPRWRRYAGLAVALLALTALSAPALTGCDTAGENCCRVCTTGRACGDTCIAAGASCNAGPGCACNG